MQTMRDVIISLIYEEMKKKKDIVFLTADLGAPALDKMRKEFKDRFINVGIAEQNLINISVGMALENYIVFSYAISKFLILRAYEQIKNNISLLSQYNKINITLLSVGTGFSYDISGPSHHCLEDTSLINILPNFYIFSPSDCYTAKKLLKKYLHKKSPKFFRLDSKPLPNIHEKLSSDEIKQGLKEIIKGKDVLLISTGFLTHTCLKILEHYQKGWGLIDIFRLKPAPKKIIDYLKNYKYVITLEESFINKGGLDTIIKNLMIENSIKTPVLSIGISDKYPLLSMERENIHKKLMLTPQAILNKIEKFIKNS